MRFVFSPAQFSVRMGATSSTSSNLVLSAALQQDSCVQLQGLPSNFLEIKKLEKSEHAKASRSLLLAKIASNERVYNARLEAAKFGGTPPSRTAAPDWHSFAYNDSKCRLKFDDMFYTDPEQFYLRRYLGTFN